MLSLLQMDGSLWPEARDALAGVAELSRLKGGDGLDIYCLNSPQYRLDLRVSHLSFSLPMSKLILNQGETEVRSFFDNIVPEGCHPSHLHIRHLCLHRPDTDGRQAQGDPGHLCPEN